MALDDSEARPIKVILVGSSGVGKTSLINSYFDQPHETDTSPTVAPAFVATTITIPSGQPVELHIWDTAGQERFQSIGGMFYRESDVAFVCFDHQVISTIPDWVERVRRQVPNCVIFLVATKIDVMPPGDVDELRDGKAALLETAHGRELYLTSSVTGQGIKEVFRDAAACWEQICAPATPAVVQVGGDPKSAPKKDKCAC